MASRIALFFSLILLASCANVMESQNQDITIETPGARGAVCYLDAGRVRYRINPPQTTNITKSKKNLIIDCLAPGNRRQKQVIEPKYSKYAWADAVTGFAPGLAWDYFSEAVFKYPDVITVDFTHTPTTPEAMPAQNAADIKQPEEYPHEEILPGRPVMNSDKFEKPFELYPREKSSAVGAAPAAQDKMIETGGSTSGKGDLIKAVNPAGNPSAPVDNSASDAAGPPAPLSTVPGQ